MKGYLFVIVVFLRILGTRNVPFCYRHSTLKIWYFLTCEDSNKSQVHVTLWIMDKTDRPNVLFSNLLMLWMLALVTQVFLSHFSLMRFIQIYLLHLHHIRLLTNNNALLKSLTSVCLQVNNILLILKRTCYIFLTLSLFSLGQLSRTTEAIE